MKLAISGLESRLDLSQRSFSSSSFFLRSSSFLSAIWSRAEVWILSSICSSSSKSFSLFQLGSRLTILPLSARLSLFILTWPSIDPASFCARLRLSFNLATFSFDARCEVTILCTRGSSDSSSASRVRMTLGNSSFSTCLLSRSA